jgi:hypothetical protein
MTPLLIEQSIRIAVPADVVFAHLSDPMSYLGLQPLLASVTEITDARTAAEGARRFRSTEIVRLLGVLPYRNRITWRMQVRPQERRIEFETRSFPRIRLEAAYTLISEGPVSVVTDTVRIDCPRWLRGFVGAQATAAHAALLANLKARLEASGGGQVWEAVAAVGGH